MSEREKVRLQKFLSRAGVASRRVSEGLMEAGRVKVNGTVVTELGTRVDPDRDTVEVDGTRVGMAAPRWILFHKPRGCLTTRTDPGGSPTVYDLLPEDARGLRYVGRLDRGTEGLLLLTNQGDLAHSLLHPSGEIDREYRVWVVGKPPRETLLRLEQGVELEDGPARAKDARFIAERQGRSLVGLVLTEGRKREVRRLFDAIDFPVRRLKRVRFGPVVLGTLPVGEWRELTDEEVAKLENAVKKARPGRKTGGRGPSGDASSGRRTDPEGSRGSDRGPRRSGGRGPGRPPERRKDRRNRPKGR
ncbi:MAG: pseudouridine synthase [Gemmatimonadota bacterium]